MRRQITEEYERGSFIFFDYENGCVLPSVITGVCEALACFGALFSRFCALLTRAFLFRWVPRLLEDFVLRYSDICKE
jgi:hypothetical protein